MMSPLSIALLIEMKVYLTLQICNIHNEYVFNIKYCFLNIIELFPKILLKWLFFAGLTGKETEMKNIITIYGSHNNNIQVKNRWLQQCASLNIFLPLGYIAPSDLLGVIAFNLIV